MSFTHGVNIILGNNGAGKTNIMEAINMISTGRSPKTRLEKELINFDAEFALVEALVVKEEEEKFIKITMQSKGDRVDKSIQINKLAKNVGDLGKHFTTVYFSPSDLDKTFATPSSRRNYLDSLIEKTNPSYLFQIINYAKAVRSRNKVLESMVHFSRGEDQLDIWTDKVITYGENIVGKRKDMLGRLNATLAENELSLDMNCTELTHEAFSQSREKELRFKATLLGPHRDGVELLLDGRNMMQFASRGQKRAAILNLRHKECQIIEEVLGEKPVLLLDDIFSELDEHNREQILNVISDPMQQTLIASAEELTVFDKIAHEAIIRL